MKKSSFIEGAMIATIAIIVIKILGMLYVIPFYATVGVQGSALYAYAYNIYVIFLDISTAGVPIAISKIINEYATLGKLDAKQRAFNIGKKVIFFMSLTAFIILFIFAREIASMLLGDLEGGNTIGDVAFVIRSISFALLIIPFLSVSRGYLQGHKIINVSSFSQVIEQVVRIAFILVGSYLALKVFDLSIRNTIGIAVMGAFIGGIIAYLYIRLRIKKNKKQLSIDVPLEKDDITNKTIIKKIFSYAFPFIVISAAMSIYNFVNMVFISRTMNFLGTDAVDVEFITTSITTWAPKIAMIVTALAMGLNTSLIPNIVEAFTLKDWPLVNKRLNKALQINLFISLPAIIGIMILAKPIWSIFYGTSATGTIILSCCIIQPLFHNMFLITSSTLQSLNKFKAVYLSTIIGLAVNAGLDIPLILLFNYLGLPPYIGCIISTVIGYALSDFIALKILNKQHGLKYTETFKLFLKLLIPVGLMAIVVLGITFIIPCPSRRLYEIIYVAGISIVGALIYIIYTYKTKLMTNIFGEEYIKKIIKKLTLGKFGR